MTSVPREGCKVSVSCSRKRERERMERMEKVRCHVKKQTEQRRAATLRCARPSANWPFPFVLKTPSPRIDVALCCVIVGEILRARKHLLRDVQKKSLLNRVAACFVDGNSLDSFQLNALSLPWRARRRSVSRSWIPTSCGARPWWCWIEEKGATRGWRGGGGRDLLLLLLFLPFFFVVKESLREKKKKTSSNSAPKIKIQRPH